MPRPARTRWTLWWSRVHLNLRTIKISRLKCEKIFIATSSRKYFNFRSYTYYATGLSDMEKVRKAVFMFSDLFGLERYNYNKLVGVLS